MRNSPVDTLILLGIRLIVSPRNSIDESLTIQPLAYPLLGQALDQDSQVGIAEVRNAVSAWVPVFLCRLGRLDNTMLGALDGVVGPASEEIGGVHNDSVFDRGGVDEVAVW